MGWGALGHFWAGDGSTIYEFCGGSVDDYTVIPESATMLLLGCGLLGLAGFRRKF